jgi:hypothetical protein
MVTEEKYLISYFGKSSSYYLEKYRAYYNGKKFSFNNSAFFVGLFWFLYRKLWIEALLIFIILFAIGIIEQIIYKSLNTNEVTQKNILYFSFFCFASIYGFIGNYLYITKADKKIKKILTMTNDDDVRMKQLKEKGGVSLVPFILLSIILILVLILNYK